MTEDRDRNGRDRCPNCGGHFVRAPRPPLRHGDDPQANGALVEKKEAARAKIDEARGELQQCASCGYQRRAQDAIEPATA